MQLLELLYIINVVCLPCNCIFFRLLLLQCLRPLFYCLVHESRNVLSWRLFLVSDHCSPGYAVLFVQEDLEVLVFIKWLYRYFGVVSTTEVFINRLIIIILLWEHLNLILMSRNLHVIYEGIWDIGPVSVLIGSLLYRAEVWMRLHINALLWWTHEGPIGLGLASNHVVSFLVYGRFLKVGVSEVE